MSRRAIGTPAIIAGSCFVAMIAATSAMGFGGNNGTVCEQPVGPDVIVGDIQSHANYPAEQLSGVWYDAFAFGTTSCNVGDVNLLWQAFNGSNRHPAISQNMFKYKVVDGSGRFEHIGQSWLKHGFTALEQDACGCGCNGDGGSVLGVGCSDPYTATRNGTQSGAGPKWQVDATSGWFPARANPAFAGTTARRLRVKSADLEASSGSVQYFAECQYVSQDDASWGNKNNNASYRRLTVTGGPNEFNASVQLSTQREKPGILAWKAIDPSVTITNVVTPETPIGPQATYSPYDVNCCTTALVIVGARATDLGGGMWHYEYAVQNLNSDRSIASFSVPIDGDIKISNVGFHDVDYHSGDGQNSITRDGTDWPGIVSSSDVTWETTPFANNANANALRWGTLYNFRFDANSPPNTGTVKLGTWKVAGELEAITVVPTPVITKPDCPADIAGDDNSVGVPDLLAVINAWGPCGGCAADIVVDGSVGVPDLLAVINAWGACPR